MNESRSKPRAVRKATEAGRGVLMKDRAYEEIKGLILDGTYLPGTFVSEGELAQRLEMSKTPIRSALERLAELGFVQISPQRGVVVREMSINEVIDHYDIRIAIEDFVVRCLAGRLSGEQIATLKAMVDEQHDLAANAEVLAYIRSDARFHLLLTEYLGNQEITRVMRHQSEKLSRVVQQNARRDIGRLRASCDEHGEIVAALAAGDAQAASAHLISHIENGKQFLVSSTTRPRLVPGAT